MKELIKRIESCNLCEAAQYKDLVNAKSKPYLEFKVYEDWVPEEVKCLLIGESRRGEESSSTTIERKALSGGTSSAFWR